MHCEDCGARVSAGARFCATCGAAITNRGPAPTPAPPAPIPPPPSHELAPPRPWSEGRGPYCGNCHQRTVPIPYFARGFNLAKGAALLAFSPVAPLLFFLIRRDRVVCSWCKTILPGEVDVPLLDAFTATPIDGGALTRYEGGGGPDALLRLDETAPREVAVHEHKSRKNRRRATTLGVAALVMGAAGGTVAIEDGFESATFLFSMSGLSGLGAAASSRRANRHRLAAETKRQRQRVLEILNLARSHAGKLTVTTVAAHMRMDLAEAEALLDSMVDGRRVDVHVDEGGRMTYVFTELTT